MKNGKYELILAPTDYPGKKYRGRYAYEHHVNWWKNNGAIPNKGYEIHHINGNHRDNRPENLQLLTAKAHQTLHGRMVREKTKIKASCANCENVFERKGSNLRSRLKLYGRVFCSRSCQVKTQQKELKEKRSEVAGRS